MDFASVMPVILFSLPLVIPAIWGSLTTKPNLGRLNIWFFHNAAAAFGTLIVLAIAVVVLVVFLLNLFFGGCGYGLHLPDSCANFPEKYVVLFFQIIVYGAFYSVFFGLPTLLVHIGVEFVTRRREKKAMQNA